MLALVWGMARGEYYRIKVDKLKVCIAGSQSLTVTATGRHLPYGITCYLSPEIRERAPP